MSYDIKQQIIDPAYQEIRWVLDSYWEELNIYIQHLINQYSELNNKNINIEYSVSLWTFTIKDVILWENVEFSSTQFEKTFNVWKLLLDKWMKKINKEIDKVSKEEEKISEFFKNLENELTINIEMSASNPKINYIVSKKYKSLFEKIEKKLTAWNSL